MLEPWMLAIAFVVAGPVIGTVAGSVSRGLAERLVGSKVPGIGEHVGTFVFWLCVAAGFVAALSMASPESLEPIPGKIVVYFPKLIVAGAIIIAGNAAAAVIAGSLASGLRRATGGGTSGGAGAIRAVIVGAAYLLAVAQLGVDLAIILIVVGGLVAALAVAAGLLIGLGGRDIAREVAAGRYLRRVIAAGDVVDVGTTTGRVVRLHAATVEIDDAGHRVHLPNTLLLQGRFGLTPETRVIEAGQPGQAGSAGTQTAGGD